MATALYGETRKMRLDVRIRESDKNIIDRAADILGMPVSDFMRSTLMERAQTVVDRQHRITLNNADRDTFLAALDSDEPLSDSLLKAAADFKVRYGE